MSTPELLEALTGDERARAVQIGRRLHGELFALLRALPHASVRGLAARLELDRNVVQRALRAGRRSAAEDPLRVLEEAPGPRALRDFVAACARCDAPRSLRQSAASAVDAFEGFVRDAGSHRRLTARLARTRAEFGGEEDREALARRAHEARFACDVDVFGTWMEARTGIFAFRPLPGDPGRIEHVAAKALLGVRARPEGLPLAAWYIATPSVPWKVELTTIDGEPFDGPSPGALVEDFCTRPLPIVGSRGEPKSRVHVIEPGAPGEPFDVVLAHRVSPATVHPVHGPEGRLTQRLALRAPTRRMVFDFWLERSLARTSVPNTGVFVKGALERVDPKQRWYDRLPHGPKLELLGEGLSGASTPYAPRHAELTRALFERAGWSADEMVGFRCQTAFPLTGPDYAISFDFRDA